MTSRRCYFVYSGERVLEKRNNDYDKTGAISKKKKTDRGVWSRFTEKIESLRKVGIHEW